MKKILSSWTIMAGNLSARYLSSPCTYPFTERGITVNRLRTAVYKTAWWVDQNRGSFYCWKWVVRCTVVLDRIWVEAISKCSDERENSSLLYRIKKWSMRKETKCTFHLFSIHIHILRRSRCTLLGFVLSLMCLRAVFSDLVWYVIEILTIAAANTYYRKYKCVNRTASNSQPWLDDGFSRWITTRASSWEASHETENYDSRRWSEHDWKYRCFDA